MRSWQMREAKAPISKAVKRAQDQGHWGITRHGERAAVPVSVEAHDRLAPGGDSLLEFMRRSPHTDSTSSNSSATTASPAR